MPKYSTDPQVESMLNLAKDLTDRMAESLKQVGRLGDERQRVFQSLFNNHNVSQVEMARICGLDKQTVHKAMNKN
jgi:DNA-binding MarR family transcriptional regulator